MSKSSKLILGTVQFGLNYGINNSFGKPEENVVRDILDTAFSRGVRYLDTAEAYGDAHQVIGNYHRTSSNKFEVITKYSATQKGLSSCWEERIREHLKELNVEQIYCYMFHNTEDFFSFDKSILDVFEDLKEKGLIKKFGVSVYSNSDIERLLKFKQVDLIQLPFNIFDNKSHRQDILLKAKEQGIEIHTRSAFLQGLFFKEINALPDKLLPLKGELETIRCLSKLNNHSIEDLALNYVFEQPFIDNVLIGVDSVQQLTENLNVLETKLSEKVINELDLIKVKQKELLNPSNWT